MSPQPVVIAGGGPVGMTAALLLARFDVPSVVLEASPRRDPIGSKALCMQRDVLDVLERVGCGDVLVEEGVTWTLGRTYFREHELFQITFPEIGESHYPPFVNIGQDRTEHWLEQAVTASPLVELHYGHRVTGYTDDGEGVGVTAETPDGAIDIEGAYLVGTDGAHSTVRKLMGAGFEGRSFDDKFLICDIRADLGFANERRFFFDPEWNPDRQVLIHPQAGSVWRIDWQVPPDFDVDEEERSGGLDARIRKIVGERDYTIVWKSVYRFHQRLATRFRVGRAFVAGDAAHLMSPFGARGLNSGIQDAENLAWKLGYVANGWADDRLLDTYEIERRAAAEENLRITGTTMDFLVPQDEAQWERRRATLESAVGNPQARHMVDSGRLATPFDYRDSPLTTPGDGAGAVTPGMLFPDAPVHVPGRRDIARLRSLFGRAFVVLSADPGLDSDDVARGGLPVEVYDAAAIDDRGVLAAAVRLPPGTAAVIRPDGHLAAIVEATPEAVGAAVDRALAATGG